MSQRLGTQQYAPERSFPDSKSPEVDSKGNLSPDTGSGSGSMDVEEAKGRLKTIAVRYWYRGGTWYLCGCNEVSTDHRKVERVGCTSDTVAVSFTFEPGTAYVIMSYGPS